MKYGNFRTSIILFVLTALLSIPVSGQQQASLSKDDKSASVQAQIDIAKAAERRSDYKAAIEAYNRVLEIDPDNYQAYQGLAGAGRMSLRKPYTDKPGFEKDEKAQKELQEKLKAYKEEIAAKYKKLAKDNPGKVVYPLLLASLYDHEPLEAMEFLDTALRIDPNNLQALMLLAGFEKSKGNNVKVNEIFKKISDHNPQDESALFNYYNSFADIDEKTFKNKADEFIKRFPKSERGAHLLYQIAIKGKDSERIESLEKLRKAYPPEKNRGSMMGMRQLFVDYLASSPDKALSFAQEILLVAPEDSKKDWQSYVDFLTSYKQAESLIKGKKPAEALQIVEKIKIPSSYEVKTAATIRLNLLKSATQAANGQTEAAYAGLMKYFVETPSDEARRELTTLGKKLGKGNNQVEADIQTAVAEITKPIKDFSLSLYDQNKNVSLADHRGKVVLLNFWFPLCGPCHAEAPFIQKMVEKYGKDKLVVLAPSAFPEQDSLVLPFFARTKYDFIPLKVPSTEWVVKEYEARTFPTNFLIDKKGNKVYRLGPVTVTTYRQVELMVEALLAQ
jgi:thiol-disulfide isomerase/thioredoxin/Tfp pilus assembly protein PilF